MPSIKKKYIKYIDYAGKKINEILDEEQLKQAVVKQSFMATTVILLNDGKGNLTLQTLPAEAQFSPVCGALFADYDRDGRIDLILTGNFLDVLPEIGRYDASYGVVLRNKGKASNGTITYETINPAASGFFVRGQVRRMARLAQGQLILAKNNAPTQVFMMNNRK